MSQAGEYQSPQEFEAAISEHEKAARAEFEAQLRAEQARARAEWQGQIPPLKIEEELARAEKAARYQFEQEAKAYKEKTMALFQAKIRRQRREAGVTFLGEFAAQERREAIRFGRAQRAARVSLKRELARTYGIYPAPRELAAEEQKQLKAFQAEVAKQKAAQQQQREKLEKEWAQTTEQQFTTSLSESILTAESSFETGITQWAAQTKEAAQKEYESWLGEQKGILETELQTWEKEQRSSFEADIAAWRKEQQTTLQEFKTEFAAYQADVAEYEKELKAWKTEWKGKGYTLKQTPEGWVAEPPTWKETTLSGQILGWAEKQPPQITPFEYPFVKKPTEVGVIAGAVGVFESFVATTESIARSLYMTVTTGKPQLVPSEVVKAPPSPLSALIGLPLGGKEAAEYALIEPEFQKPYLFGGILGEIALFYAAKKVTTKVFEVVSPVFAPVTEKVGRALKIPQLKTALTRIYLEKGLYKISPVWQLKQAYRGSVFHKAAVKLGIASKWIAPEATGLSEIIMVGGKPQPWMVTEQILPQVTKLTPATEFYWKMLQTPKTYGVYVYGAGLGYRGAKPSFVAFAKAGVAGYIGKGVPMFTAEELTQIKAAKWGITKAPTLPELIAKEKIMPVLARPQLVRVGIIAPSLPVIAAPKAPTISRMGSLILGATKIVPSVQPSLKPTTLAAIMQPSKLKAPPLKKPARREIPSVSPFLSSYIFEQPAVKEKAAPIAAVSPLSAQIIGMKPALDLGMPTPPSFGRYFFPSAPKREPEKRKAERRRKRAKVKPEFGKYEVLYPVTTVGEVAKYVMGESKKK